MAEPKSGGEGNARFASTNWRIITTAQDADLPEARQALAHLCTAYWYPLYAYLRRKGHSADSAQDFTQGFFASLLEHDFLKDISAEKGKFRTFLLASLQHYVANQRVHDQALKRGGGRVHSSIDMPDAESRYAVEPSHTLTAERFFERRWALTLLERVLERLGNEMKAAGKGALFDHLGQALLGGGEAAPYAWIGKELAMTEGAVKVAAHRLRARYRDLIREEVVQTLDDPNAVEEEILALFAALRR